MKKYDVIVIGAGVGMSIVFKAISDGMRVALVDKGYPGGTCINVGCLPSKMLIYPADRITEIREATRLGIHAKITRIDFSSMMKRMKTSVRSGRKYLANEIGTSKNLDYYNEEAHFVGERTLEVESRNITGKQIFIASGSRPSIPPIKGLDNLGYLTNETVLGLRRIPKSVMMIGGGYIAVEYAHFFEAMGARVTILEIGERLVSTAEPEISDLLKKELSRRMRVLTGVEILDIKKKGHLCAALVRERSTGIEKEINAAKIMVAAGRKSNADLLKVEKAGIETTDRARYIKVNDYLQTNKKDIWAFGDAIGRQMFTHAGYQEAEIAWHNSRHSRRIRMNFQSTPSAVFTHPQIASVGLTEAEARTNYKILVGKAKYSDIVAGDTMIETEGFAKAIVEKNTRRILGFHIIGPYASHIIQEVVNVVANKSAADYITRSMHTFPALSELVPQALTNLREIGSD